MHHHVPPRQRMDVGIFAPRQISETRRLIDTWHQHLARSREERAAAFLDGFAHERFVSIEADLFDGPHHLLAHHLASGETGLLIQHPVHLRADVLTTALEILRIELVVLAYEFT